MLVNKLALPIAPQKNAKRVEPSDDALQFYPVHQKSGEGYFVFADMIEKRVLKILFIGSHFLLPSVIWPGLTPFLILIDVRNNCVQLRKSPDLSYEICVNFLLWFIYSTSPIFRIEKRNHCKHLHSPQNHRDIQDSQRM